MKVILAKDIEKLGNAGDVVKVKDGYARNYLIPKGLALVSNEKNVRELEFNRRMIDKKINSEVAAANALAAKLATCEIKVQKKVGEEGKLFGSVTNREIEDALKEKGFSIDRKSIVLDSNIKKSGVYEVEVKLFREIRGMFKLWVVAEESETVPTAAEEAATEPAAPAEETEAVENAN